MKNIYKKKLTLIELLIVIIIIGLILALALPGLGKFPAGVLTRKTISDIESAFTQARLMALASGAQSSLHFGFESNEIFIKAGHPANDFGLMLQRAKNPDSEDSEEEPIVKRSKIFASIKSSLHNGVSVKPLEEADLSDAYTEKELAERYSYDFYADGEALGPVLGLNIGTKKYHIEVDRLTGRPIITPQDEN